jgi:hypothetical protein
MTIFRAVSRLVCALRANRRGGETADKPGFPAARALAKH